jgi:hypothetical protein
LGGDDNLGNFTVVQEEDRSSDGQQAEEQQNESLPTLDALPSPLFRLGAPQPNYSIGTSNSKPPTIWAENSSSDRCFSNRKDTQVMSTFGIQNYNGSSWCSQGKQLAFRV